MTIICLPLHYLIAYVTHLETAWCISCFNRLHLKLKAQAPAREHLELVEFTVHTRVFYNKAAFKNQFHTFPMCFCRISVGSFDTDIVGSCLLCGSPFDDYSSRCRCNNCRMLVLVCDSCQVCTR